MTAPLLVSVDVIVPDHGGLVEVITPPAPTIDIAALGPPGPKGDTGAQGAKGDTGAQGPAGANALWGLTVERTDAGFTTVPRTSYLSASSVASGTLRLGYFTAPASGRCTGLAIPASGSPSVPTTATLVRIGVWRVEANGSLTMIGSIPNDLTLFTTVDYLYERAWSAPFDYVAGQRYAWGPLMVGASYYPLVVNLGAGAGGTGHGKILPRLCAYVAGLADLPNNIPAASQLTSSLVPFGAMTGDFAGVLPGLPDQGVPLPSEVDAYTGGVWR